MSSQEVVLTPNPKRKMKRLKIDLYFIVVWYKK